MTKNRLGKGLGALISDNKVEKPGNKEIQEIYIQQIEPNPYQPRQEFEQKALEELAQSIKEQGIIQPITVRQISPDSYQLVTGERRWRAAKLAGLKRISAIVQDFTEEEMMEIALIENLQREDLNPIEEAQAYQRMIKEFGMTQEEVAQKVGKGRSSIANLVRLLNLPPKVQVYVSRETLTMGHARTLLALKSPEEQIKAAEYVIKHNLSVRETEKYIQQLTNRQEKKAKPEKETLEPEWAEAEKILARYLGAKVRVRKKKDRRVITIECQNFATLEKLLDKVENI